MSARIMLFEDLPGELDFIEREWARHRRSVRNRARQRRRGWRPGR